MGFELLISNGVFSREPSQNGIAGTQTHVMSEYAYIFSSDNLDIFQPHQTVYIK